MIKVREDMTGWNMWEHGVSESRLTVIKQVEDYVSPSGHHYNRWLCQCSCKEKNLLLVQGRSLKSGNTRSCGCLEKELKIQRLKKTNEFRIVDNVVIGKSSNTNDEFFVDICDFDKIKNICWSVRINKSGMKELCGWDQTQKKTVRMHTLLGFPNYDHIDRNELNNRRNNLRQATPQEQIWNRGKAQGKSSNVVGVSYYARDDKWVAELSYNYKRIFRQYCQTEEEAILARLNAEIKHIPIEFAPNRHLFEKYGITTQNDCEVAI